MGWARNFIGKYVVKKGDIIEVAAKVETGIKNSVPLAAQDLCMVMLRSEQNSIALNFVLETALVAPVAQGARRKTHREPWPVHDRNRSRNRRARRETRLV
jgi:hypothetical protein